MFKDVALLTCCVSDVGNIRCVQEGVLRRPDTKLYRVLSKKKVVWCVCTDYMAIVWCVCIFAYVYRLFERSFGTPGYSL